MFSKKWETSKRKYQAVHEPEVAIPVSAGFTLDSDVFRPDSDERFPVILSVFPFYKEKQNQPVKPVAVCPEWVMAEGGDYNFYVRRGYVHVFANLRGSGKSGGEFDHLGDGCGKVALSASSVQSPLSAFGVPRYTINAFQPGRHIPQGLKPACWF